MTKDEWLWVAIRIAGLYLLVLALIAVPQAIATAYALGQLVLDAESGETGRHLAAIKKAALGQGVKALSEMVLFTLAGLYLLRRGKLVHQLAGRDHG